MLGRKCGLETLLKQGIYLFNSLVYWTSFDFFYIFFFICADEIRQTCVKEDLNKGDCKDVLAEEGCYEKVV